MNVSRGHTMANAAGMAIAVATVDAAGAADAADAAGAASIFELDQGWADHFRDLHKKKGDEFVVSSEQLSRIKRTILDHLGRPEADPSTIAFPYLTFPGQYPEPNMAAVQPPMPYPDGTRGAVTFKYPVLEIPGKKCLGHVVYGGDSLAESAKCRVVLIALD